MFNISHFSERSSHRIPVLQLYRRLLRHARHFPGDLAEQLTDGITLAFRRAQKIRSPIYAKRQIELGYQWELKLRESHLQNNSPEALKNLSDEIETFNQSNFTKNSTLPQHSNISHKPALTMIDFDKNSIDVFRNQQLSLEYNKPLQKGSLDYEQFISESRADTFRKRALRWLRARDLLSTKEAIDMSYIDLFIVPQLRQARHLKQTELRRIRETQYRPVRVSSLLTPDGPFTVLFVPGQGHKTSPVRAMRIFNALHKDVSKKIDAVTDMIELARHEGLWEVTTEPSSSSLSSSSSSSVVNAWTKPWVQYKHSLLQSRAKNFETNRRYRKILLAKKSYLDNILKGVTARNRQKWSKYQRPKLHDIGRLYRGVYNGPHSNMTRYVHK